MIEPGRQFKKPAELTEREKEIATAMGRGERAFEIASRLGITDAAARSAQKRALEKLGLFSARQLGEHARKHGWC